MPPRKSTKSKNPPIFSHDFVIQNHADIVSCVAMVFILGLMFQATNKVASLFVTVQHNVTVNDTQDADQEKLPTFYEYGFKDMFSIFFYFLIAIVIHAVLQEYILDKINRKLHLSKTKHSKFNESGQLVIFYAAQTAWAIDIIIRQQWLNNVQSFWQNYPHTTMTFQNKFYILIQLAFWFHSYPELYLQKVKKEEILQKCIHPTLYIFFIIGAYLLNFSRLLIALLILHYFAELAFHAARLTYLIGYEYLASNFYRLWNAIFIIARLSTVTLSVLTLWFGLSHSSKDKIDLKLGDFNTLIVRINSLLAVGLLQAWLMWNFITFHLKRARRSKDTNSINSNVSHMTPKHKSKKNSKESNVNGLKKKNR